MATTGKADVRTLRAEAALLQLVPDAIMVRELGTGAIQFWSHGAEELYGWSSAEAIGRTSHELLQTGFPTDQPLSAIEIQLSAQGRWAGELKHTTRDGRRIVVSSRWAVQRDEVGRPVAYLEVNTDVTEQRQAEAEQRRLLAQAEAAEAQFRGLLESAPDAVVIIDGGGAIQLVNRQTEALFGYTRDELIGRSVEMLLPHDLRTRHLEHRAEYMANPRTRPMGTGLELSGRRQDDSEFPVEISLSPVTSGTDALVISIIRDVTARKLAQEQLKAAAAELARSNADLEQFAYVASHDLQEPLRMVASYTQLLGRRYRGKLDQDADDFIAFAVDGAQRMQALINDLLAYSRVGTREIHLDHIHTRQLVEEVVRDLSPDDSGTVTIDDLPAVEADPVQLRQLFQNLIANAIKFHRPSEQPRVRVFGRRDGASSVISVQDNGIGIEPQYMERIFTLFQRLHTREEYPGTGIGLAICKKVVERHGGTMWVESEPGHGSTFSFSLPNSPRLS